MSTTQLSGEPHRSRELPLFSLSSARNCPSPNAFLGGEFAFDDEMTLRHAPAGAGSYRFFDSGLLWSFARRMAHMTYFDEHNVSNDQKRQYST